ncbi:MAG: nucleotide sugar dehydrogenase [candidate division WOR-3 bacterium]|nr:nucleotide sugar dehydrogenase [candidate division WOR-3 bacterium]MCX7947390.1 nucleotide sugar dehydrogenase [candidate division WOR-3 bacterium]MDW8150054.1 nucleotide sugar dehydrogenase [candidate division WOR-3 bacterium]
MEKEILKKLEAKELKISILGLGYVGLPLALEFYKNGFEIYGIDVDKEKVEKLNNGISYVLDVSNEEIKDAIKSGKFKVFDSYEVIKEVDVIIIAVPTPLSKTKDPDLSYILDAVENIKNHLKKGHIVILESTTYPGTTDEIIKSKLEETGLKCGEDFFLAFSPERINPGDKVYKIKNTPKVVGGVDEISGIIVKNIYSKIVDEVVLVSSSKVAEMAKLLENTFRAVNIALVNELAIMCNILNIDVWEVIESAGSKPFGFMKFYPGPGIGGHCIPIDPIYLSWKMKTLNYNARLIEVASEINTNMPRYVVQRISDILNEYERSIKGSRILILGVTYKKDVSDIRESPAIDIISMLADKGAIVYYFDPYVEKINIGELEIERVELTSETIKESDIVVLITDHSVFDYDFIYKNSNLIFDTKNAFRKYSEKVYRL